MSLNRALKSDILKYLSQQNYKDSSTVATLCFELGESYGRIKKMLLELYFDKKIGRVDIADKRSMIKATHGMVRKYPDPLYSYYHKKHDKRLEVKT